LFLLAHLVPLVSPMGPIQSAGQLAVEAAVPQHKSDANRRKEPDVCKDLVVWPRPWMTCWEPSSGLPRRYPMAIVELKVISWRDSGGIARKKTHEHREYDVPFLQRMSAEQEGFIGYAVLVDLRSGFELLSCGRAFAGDVDPAWLSCPLPPQPRPRLNLEPLGWRA
jgi:hypothetical protein